MVGGSRLFLTFWRSLGGSLGEQVVFMKTRFCHKTTRRMLDNHGNGKDVACFRQVLKTTHCDAIFVSPNWIFWNANSVELNMAFFDTFNSLKRSFSQEKHKCDEDDDIRL